MMLQQRLKKWVELCPDDEGVEKLSGREESALRLVHLRACKTTKASGARDVSVHVTTPGWIVPGADGDKPPMLCQASSIGIYPAGIGKLRSGEIFQLRLLNCPSGDQVPDGLLNGRPVIPQGWAAKGSSSPASFGGKHLKPFWRASIREWNSKEEVSVEIYPRSIPTWKNHK